FDVTSALIDGSPHVANYMANAIGVLHLGADGQFQPFISGGFGRTAIGADFLDVQGSSRKGGWGSNIGGARWRLSTRSASAVTSGTITQTPSTTFQARPTNRSSRASFPGSHIGKLPAASAFAGRTRWTAGRAAAYASDSRFASVSECHGDRPTRYIARRMARGRLPSNRCAGISAGVGQHRP